MLCLVCILRPNISSSVMIEIFSAGHLKPSDSLPTTIKGFKVCPERTSPKKSALKFKSKWEAEVARQIEERGYEVNYEKLKLKYIIPESEHTYTPDFEVGDWIIEAKGKFDPQDRKKHLLLKEQYPEKKILLIFLNANQRLSKKSKTTYAQWCEKNGIHWQHRKLVIPNRK